MATIKKKIEHSGEWVTTPSHSLVTKREMDMFLMGKENGVEEYKKKRQDIFNFNFVKSYDDANKILDIIKAFNIQVISARLKIEALNVFRIAISLKQTEELNSKIEDIYNSIYELEESESNDSYSVDFSIIKANESFDDKCVENDGYIYKHRLTINEESTRTA